MLHNNDSSALRGVLRGGLDPSVVFNLPVGDPDVEKFNLSEGKPVALGLLLAFFPKIIKTNNPNPPQKHVVENEFLRMLRKVHPEEYDVLIRMKDGKLSEKYKGLTKKLVEDAFPDLIKG